MEFEIVARTKESAVFYRFEVSRDSIVLFCMEDVVTTTVVRGEANEGSDGF
jgi:hypothetical protein